MNSDNLSGLVLATAISAPAVTLVNLTAISKFRVRLEAMIDSELARLRAGKGLRERIVQDRRLNLGFAVTDAELAINKPLGILMTPWVAIGAVVIMAGGMLVGGGIIAGAFFGGLATRSKLLEIGSARLDAH